MKKLLYSLAVIAAMFCSSCDHYDHAIADQGDRIAQIEKYSIKDIDEQVNAINTSLVDLEAVDASLQTLIDGLQSKADSLLTELNGNASADASLKESLQESIEDINEVIEDLKEMDSNLDGKVAELKTYVDSVDASMSNSLKEWAETTFATLKHYDSLQTSISGLSTKIDGLETAVGNINTSLGNIETSIDNLETSMKSWVNDTLANGYYTISQLDAKLTALAEKDAELAAKDTLLENADAELEKLILAQQDSLAAAKTSITSAYESAISAAILKYDGEVTDSIAVRINAAKTELQDDIDDINEVISKIEERLDKIEERLDNIEGTVEGLVARIQSLRFLPEYSDGKVELNNETTLSFIISPKETAAAIAEAAKDDDTVVTAYVTRTKARTKAVDMPTSLTVTSVKGDANGILEVCVSDINLPDDFWKEVKEGNIYINISDGNNDVLSEMIPILPMSYIATKDDFLAAFNIAKTTGEVVRLSADIALEEPIALTTGDNVTIDLNGHTISTESSQTGKNFDMFDVNKGSVLTVKNGTLTTKHNVNMGWSQSTNVFNVTAGGVLNIENATIKNLGGSDMAFCIHLNNWGEVTLNVNNSTLESTYMAVRVFNSGPNMNNVTIKNSNLKGNNYCFWVHNYTIEDFGTQDKVDSQKALLNLDIYNNNNNFDCGIAAARFGFTNAELYDGTGAKVVADVVGLEKAIKAGGEFKLVKDITLTKSIAVNNVDFVLDGNGKTITMADGTNNPIALLDISGVKATLKNVTFDGIKGGGVVRTVYSDFTADGVTVKNFSDHTFDQGIFRLVGKSTLSNCTFKDNTCNMVVSYAYDAAPDEPFELNGCVFENNSCSLVGTVYYNGGSAAIINGNKFLNNSLNMTANGATLYLGFKKNCTVTNNIFKDNKVTTTSTSTKRIAGALMVGNDAVITGNAFVDNVIESPLTGMANDVCASVYYSSINLSGNYWGGGKPEEGNDYYIEYPDKNEVIIEDYLTTYEGL